MTEISVIVPVFKAESYLRRCLDSVLAQTFKNFELILVDDGSPDGSGIVCDEYNERDDRIRVLHQKNQGQASARNNAVKISKGKLICFVDADDAIHPQMLEVLYNNLNNLSTSISVCGAIEDNQVNFSNYYFNGNDYKTYIPNEDTLMKLYYEPYICWTVWGKLIPKSIIDKYPFENNRVYEDNAVVIKWLYSAESISYLPDPLYFYQINMEGTTKSGWSEKKNLDYFWARGEQLAFIKEKKMNKLFDLLLPKYLFDLARDYYNKKEEQPNYSKKVRKIASWWWKRYHKQLNIEKGQRQFIYHMINPCGEAILEWIENHSKKREHSSKL